MRAMQIIEWGQPLEAREYPDPEPQGEEVLLRVEAAGVCHSDVHIWDGHFDLGGGQHISLESRGVQLPFTMGHEIAGEVVALGPQASGVKPGDKVVAYPWIGCGQCAVCKKGEELLCLRPRTLPPVFRSLSAALAWSAGRVSIGIGGTLPACTRASNSRRSSSVPT